MAARRRLPGAREASGVRGWSEFEEGGLRCCASSRWPGPLDEADGVGATDRVGLAEQKVGKADLSVGVGAAEGGQRLACLDAYGGEIVPEKARDVLVALPPLDRPAAAGRVRPLSIPSAQAYAIGSSAEPAGGPADV